MQFIQAAYIPRQAGPTSQELVEQFNAGRKQKMDEWGVIATQALDQFSKDAPMRMLKLSKAPPGSSIEEVLAPDFNLYVKALHAQNQATGGKKTPEQILEDARDYFSRYYGWGERKMREGGYSTNKPKAAQPSSSTPPAAPAPSSTPAPVPDPQMSRAVSKTIDATGAYSQSPGVTITGPASVSVTDPTARSTPGVVPAAAKKSDKDILAEYLSPGGSSDAVKKQAYNDMMKKYEALRSKMSGENEASLQAAIENTKDPVVRHVIQQVLSAKRAQSSGTGKKGAAEFAEGGQVDTPTVALIGEQGETEYVVPRSKALAWAKMFLDDPSNPPNPADMPDDAIPPSQYGPAMGPNDIPIDAAVPAPMRPSDMSPAPDYGRQDLSELTLAGDGSDTFAQGPVDSRNAITGVMEGAGEQGVAGWTDKPISKQLKVAEDVIGSLSEETKRVDRVKESRAFVESFGDARSKLEGRINDAKKSIEASAVARKALPAILASPEYKDLKREQTASFKQWFDNATPEELSLMFPDAAQLRHSGVAHREEMALKYKYFDLQEKASQGDSGAVAIKLAADYMMKYIETNKDIIEKKGAAKARTDDPTLNNAMNFLEQFAGVATTDVIKTLFKYKLIESVGNVQPVDTKAGAATSFDWKKYTGTQQ